MTAAVRHLHPVPDPTATAQAHAAGHPSVYDHHAEARPATLLALAVEVLIRSILSPGRSTRAQQVEAAQVLADHFAIDIDTADPHGIPRPEATT